MSETWLEFGRYIALLGIGGAMGYFSSRYTRDALIDWVGKGFAAYGVVQLITWSI